MRVAVFGAGRIGPLHGRTLLANPAVERLTIVDPIAERARTSALELGAAWTTDAESALDAADAVVLATSTADHPALIRAAVGRGLPTFCEKPLAADLTEAIALLHVVDSAGTPFQLGFQRRFDPAYVEARRLIETGALGTIHLLSLRSHDPAPASEDFIASSGGMFRDLAIHDVDVLRFLSGIEVKEVFVVGTSRPFPLYEKYGDHANAVCAASLTDGTPVSMSWARHHALGHDVRTEIFGSLDSVGVGFGPRMPLRSVEPDVRPPEGPLWSIFLDRWDDAYRDEMDAFIRVARGDEPSPCTARDGVQAQRIAEALAMSAADHRVVALTEVPG